MSEGVAASGEDISRLAISSAVDAGITLIQESHIQRLEEIGQNGDDLGIAHDNSLGDNKEAILKLLHEEIWRVRTLIGGFHGRSSNDGISDAWPLQALFPIDVPTVAPMMEMLTIHIHINPDFNTRMGSVHCPQIRTLFLWTADDMIESFVAKPMLNAQRLQVASPRSPIIWHFKLLEAMPNLVHMSWDLGEANDTELPVVPVVLQHLKFLAVSSLKNHTVRLFLRSLNIPSLEYLDFAHYTKPDTDHLNEALNTLCAKGTVWLRHLTLRNTTPMAENVYHVLNHLMHLETLNVTCQNRPVDSLLIALSPHNRDFSSACPKLEAVELRSVNVSAGTLVEFVERRVQSDSEEPALGLVARLKLSGIHGVDDWEGLCSRLAETHSSSIDFLFDEDEEYLMVSGLGLI